ncbi:MAG: hypothetical protein IPP72_09550 [Chitinophagaceae bacterium]|nr:hypothetical protein [Chitinophagaceae bacterium]
MKLRNLRLALLACGTVICNIASAQLFIDQATFTIQSGATVTVQGDVTSNVDIQGTGKVILKGTANQNVNLNGFSVPNVEVDNASNVTLTGNAKVAGDLLFTNGKVLLGNNNLSIASAGTITGASNAKYVVTNGTGKLVKAALGAAAFTFPIGNSTTAYNPLAISNSGTADSIGARAFATVLSAGTTGTAFTKEVVNNSWDVSEAVAGGSNLSVTATWSGTDELSGFDRTRSGISYYIPTVGATQGWDLLNSQTTAAVGANPYTYTRTAVTSVGTFAVGTRPVLSPLLVTPKVFLQGAYSAGLMTDGLRSGNLIPTTEPYTASNVITAVLRGSGGGETSTASIIGSAAGASTANSIVDWVVVQLHNTGSNAVLSQRAALLQRDGDVVDVDGVSPVNMAGNAAGSYFVSVRHRNHLGVRTAAGLTLAKTTNTNYDFTSSLAQAYAVGITNNVMATLVASTTFGMWAGDASGNKQVKYTGPGNDENQLLNTTLGGVKGAIISGYNNSDLNMNGQVKYTGPGNDENILLNIVLAGAKGAIISQPNF